MAIINASGRSSDYRRITTLVLTLRSAQGAPSAIGASRLNCVPLLGLKQYNLSHTPLKKNFKVEIILKQGAMNLN